MNNDVLKWAMTDNEKGNTMTKEQMIKKFTEMLNKAEFVEREATNFSYHTFEFKIDGNEEKSFWLMEKNGKLEWF